MAAFQLRLDWLLWAMRDSDIGLRVCLLFRVPIPGVSAKTIHSLRPMRRAAWSQKGGGTIGGSRSLPIFASAEGAALNFDWSLYTLLSIRKVELP